MALHRRIYAASFTITLSLLACTPTPNDAAEAAAASQARQPTVVCQHVRTLAANDTKDEQVLDGIQRDCVQTLEALASRYETFATCVEDSTTSAAVFECEKALAKPPSLLVNASPTGQLETVCDHVISRLQAEIPGAADSANPENVEKLRTRCIDEAGKKREEIGAEAFARQVQCLLAANDIEALQACGSF